MADKIAIEKHCPPHIARPHPEAAMIQISIDLILNEPMNIFVSIC
jgi:hypothetical protein